MYFCIYPFTSTIELFDRKLVSSSFIKQAIRLSLANSVSVLEL